MLHLKIEADVLWSWLEFGDRSPRLDVGELAVGDSRDIDDCWIAGILAGDSVVIGETASVVDGRLNREVIEASTVPVTTKGEGGISVSHA
jgi:hypothetical protein